MGLALIFGLMERSIVENGLGIRWMEVESFNGRMDGSSEGGIAKIRNMELESLCGRMEGGLKGCGCMGSR